MGVEHQPVNVSRWWFQIFFMFTPKIGEDSHFDSYFSKGLVQPPTTVVYALTPLKTPVIQKS